LSHFPQTNGRLESERDDVRRAVCGEFSSALESLSEERGNLLNELSDLRLRLAEVVSEKEAAEKDRRREVDAEVKEIHQR
jgi:regulator of replication initiation timing